MNMRSKLVAITGSALILASSITMGSAAPTDTGNATVSITTTTADNFLAVSISDGQFVSKPYNLAAQSTTGSLTITATDTRGTGAGWHVNLSAEDFKRDNDTTIDISNLTLNAGLQSVVSAPANDNTPLVGLSGANAAPVQETGTSTTEVWSADVLKGEGEYTMVMNGTLNIPGGTLSGSYMSVVSVAVESGP